LPSTPADTTALSRILKPDGCNRRQGIMGETSKGGPAMALAPSVTEQHPGLTDPVYRARREEIARIGETFHSGEPIPVVRYTMRRTASGVWCRASSRQAPS
jgi:hypothetical protein